jgi:hypothetical protein
VIAAYCLAVLAIIFSAPIIRKEVASVYRKHRGKGRLGLFVMLGIMLLFVCIVPGGLAYGLLERRGPKHGQAA